MTLDCSNRCDVCTNYKDIGYYLKKDALPVWKDDEGVTQFHVPECLKCLTIPEKMLIQRVSPVVPMMHLKNGVNGLTGHCCAYEQDVKGFINRLPRSLSDVKLLRVLKRVQSEIGMSKENRIQKFKVRRIKVYEALEWLNRYNKEYADIEIDKEALNWLEGDEGEIDAGTILTDEIATQVDTDERKHDLGPVPQQLQNEVLNGDNVREFGFVDDTERAPASLDDTEITMELQDAVEASADKRDIAVDWPDLTRDPISEHSGRRLFTNAFPWLFPGGVGDVMDYPGEAHKWGEHMLYYEDGRFACDEMFGFYALNFIVRKRNSSSGKWFINMYKKSVPPTLTELQEQLKNGNKHFLNCMNYHNSCVTGSSPYWFKKRMELYAWVNYHVQAGNGAPMFFITLSCAEYMWVDIEEKILERMRIAGEDTTNCGRDKTGWTSIVNRYSIVVQEYFQKRVTTWLETIGKVIFGIKHHWIRYEFAAGRGQIHAHLLAITEDQSIYKLAYLDKQDKIDGDEKRTERIAKWAKERIGLTAWVSDDFDDIEYDPATRVNAPMSMRFRDVPSDERSMTRDFEHLLRYVQYHECNGFCMRNVKGSTT